MKWKKSTGRVLQQEPVPPAQRTPCGPRTRHLMIQHEQKGTLDVEVSRPFHLEAICLLGGRHPVPLAGGRGELFHQRVGTNTHLALPGAQDHFSAQQQVSLCSPCPRLLTSTRWLSGPYSSLSSSITRLLKNDENFLFCLLGWRQKRV